MTLKEICKQVAEIEMELAQGGIDCSCDNLVSAMKPGHRRIFWTISSPWSDGTSLRERKSRRNG